MKTVKDDKFSILQNVYLFQKQYRFALTVLSGFTLDETPVLLDDSELWDNIQPALGKKGVFDLTMPKPRGEAVVIGKCVAPGGKPVSYLDASFQIGAIHKRVIVFGDRIWKKSGTHWVMSDPEPFLEKDISWENAFGGPKFKKNPDGKGQEDVELPTGDIVRPLPNVENPDNLIVSTSDKADPVGFAPLGLTWSARLKNLGTYDKKWLKEDWPGYPDDFDFGYFNVAPEDQRLEDFWVGGEDIEIVNMHPEKRKIRSQVPQITPRGFVNSIVENRESFEEIPLNMDTIWLFPNQNTGVAIWRGETVVSDDEATQISHIVAFFEGRGETPKPLAYYQSKMVEKPVEEKPEPPESEEAAAEKSEAKKEDEGGAKPEIEKLTKKEEKELKKLLNERFPGLNLDFNKPAPGMEKLMAQAPKPSGLLGKLGFSNIDPAKMDDAALEKEITKLFKKQGIDLNKMASPKLLEPSKVQQLEKLKAWKKAFKAQGIDDPEMLAAFDEVEADLMKPDVPEKAVPLTKETEPAELAAGKGYAGADLTGMDLSGKDLRKCDFSGAILENVNFSDANLEGAILSNAILTGALLTGAKLKGAKLAEVSASGCNFVNADLSGADLSNADLYQAEFSEAKLNGAILKETNFSAAKLKKAKCMGVLAEGAKFENADLSGSIFQDSNLCSADLSGAFIDKANFEKANLSGAKLYETTGKAASFKDADLHESRSDEKTRITGANFAGANLSKVAWNEADFQGSDFSGSDFSRGSVVKCNMESANFQRVGAKNADFSKCNFSKASMIEANFFKGSLRKANLMGADLSRSNLYGADFYQAMIQDTLFEEANLKKTLLAQSQNE